MVLEEETERKVECWLKRKHVNVEEIAGFTFMQYISLVPASANLIGVVWMDWVCLSLL